MNLAEIANKQKFKPFIYLVIFIFTSLFLFVFIYSTALIISQNRESEVSSADWLLYFLVNAFIFGATIFFNWNLYKDLQTDFSDEGVDTNWFKRSCLKWSEVNRALFKKSGAIIIESDGRKIRINTLFYRNTAILFQLFNEKLGEKIEIES